MSDVKLTLGQVTELVIVELSGGKIPQDSPYEEPYIDVRVVAAVNEVLKGNISIRKGASSIYDASVPVQVLFNYNVEVKKDNVSDRLYVEVPAFFFDLPHGKGINRLCSSKDVTDVYSRIVDVSVHANTFAAYHKGYYSESNRIYLWKPTNQEKDNLILTLATGADVVKDRNSILPILPEQLRMVINMVKEDVLNRVVRDEIKDNNPQISNEQQGA